jgi:hypothetical protein
MLRAALALAIVALQVDVARLGPAIGADAPGFSLADQQGRTQTLETLAGPQGTMLVFFRSADW